MNPSSSRPRSRRWIGFFLVLAVLAAAAIVIPIVYNLSIQLRPEQLSEARRLWRENKPSDYDLEYLVKTLRAGQKEENQYLVQVRNEWVVLIAVNQEVIYVDAALAVLAGPGVSELSPVEAGRYGVQALFDEIEAALRRDETRTGRSNFATARFDPRDGHPYHYVHRARDTKEGVEWNVKLTRLAAAESESERR